MSGNILCPICVEDFDSTEAFEAHKKTNEHRIKWLNRTYHTNRKEFVQDKHGLSIDVKKEGPIQYLRNIDTISVKTEEELQFDIILRYNGSQELLLIGADVLNESVLLSADTRITLEDQLGICQRIRFLLLRKGGCYKIKCFVEPGSLMRTLHIPIIFEFQWHNEGAAIFYYGKNLELAGTSYNLLNFGDAVPGVRLPKTEGDELEKILPFRPYYISAEFMRLAYDNDATALSRLMRIQPKINHTNYKNFFKTLLWLEELQLHLDIQFYSKKNARLTNAPKGNSGVKCAELLVEGLSENRPSVLLGDKIMASRCIEDRPHGIMKRWYEGIVHNLTSNSVYLGFHQDLFMRKLQDNGMLCDIEFIISRSSLRYCHRALELCSDDLRHLLFPMAPRHTAPPLPDVSPYNDNLSNNPEQLQAVKHIVAGSSHPAPYLVFGPPGTGKTVTIVEAIKQVLYNKEKSRVLACAPSNSAADIITEYLLEHLTHEHVFRLYAASREKHANKISERIKSASNFGSGNKVYFPPKDALMKKRVIVCTFITAARIAAAAFPPNFFTHVFLDEVGHAMEPEALVAVGGVLSTQGHLVLAGDHHQLGPVVRSQQAKGGANNHIFSETGLDMSYLERLMRMDAYQEKDGRYNPRLVTKLLNNYRSHKDILKVPNELFYNSQLKVRGETSITDSFTKWPELPKKGFPLIFHSTPGQDLMTKKSPSYYNPDEVNVVLKYIKKLLSNTSDFKLKESDIGIITPYRLQVQKIREALRKKFPDCHERLKVGSVEDFQGEERKVIIISTVRATRAHLAKDEIFALGFLRNPKRFNVAVTRAKALLIVSGCANILQMDRNWKKLIDHIRRGGGYVGNAPSSLTEDLDSIYSDLTKIDSRPMVGRPSITQIVEAPPFAEE